ncbi:DUF2516 family protein [Demequina sp. SYSU T00192]|uniref:DUF2516 family protein n=1 Tax=Demequina litoralis TaxID=3051660 RepID=A0ABT8G7Y4_9MICO|nr:DUF2516 family protein [Demequina sp. SYSU T00192]MDN4475233.1 DUF2516 family protein [Demequina sp. SYSU T00192]
MSLFGWLQNALVLLISVAAFAGAIWGLVDAFRRPETAFTAAGKWSKTIWLVILGVATIIAFISLPWPLGTGGGIGGILGIAAIVAVIIYFVDVRPKLGGGYGSSGGSQGRSSGGW